MIDFSRPKCVELIVFIRIVLNFQVKQLKENIEKEKGAESYAVGCQKLIYAGKIMADDDAISKYNIDEKKFVVVMVTKTKPAAAPAASAAPAAAESDSKKDEPMETSSEPAAPEKKEEKKSDEPAASAEPAAAPAAAAASAGTDTSASSGPAVAGEELNSMVQNIMAMGYPREEVRETVKKQHTY